MKPIMHNGYCVGVEGRFGVTSVSLVSAGDDLRLLRLQHGMRLMICAADDKHVGTAYVAKAPQTAERIEIEFRLDPEVRPFEIAETRILRIYIPTQFMRNETVNAMDGDGTSKGTIE